MWCMIVDERARETRRAHERRRERIRVEGSAWRSIRADQRVIEGALESMRACENR